MEAWIGTTPRELLDTSIAQLETLRVFLGEQLVSRTDGSESDATSDVIACQEILISVGALIVRIQTARATGLPAADATRNGNVPNRTRF